jgi:hypothetical protein
VGATSQLRRRFLEVAQLSLEIFNHEQAVAVNEQPSGGGVQQVAIACKIVL